LPTNWTSLSNAVNWEFIAGICEQGGLPPATELYSVLPEPIDLDSIHRSIFLIRSKPRSWPAQARGRWVIGLGFRWPGQQGYDTNRADRTWVAEAYLPARSRSKLPMNGTPHP
jgi:hypothetical protein